MEANEYILDAFKEKDASDEKDDDHTNIPSGGESEERKDNPEQKEPENIGTLMLDATCAPSNIRYPQDFPLLNEAREKLFAVKSDNLPAAVQWP